ncbi:MAG TPA: UDP-2,3-diacylglucosamine diphosphatase [candidate division Zixibacteria bacterium]|nr:UDP-2,3-diacylglucosamine diphosphatase [candidate division Zixibacteria bacterium]MDD4918279.1 UDP-2,3-diacylglucosamine diphosphatase [candidate division Zixibacteria bacterium]MDM7973178.1 UDP-2,3-diacylglucosamine diphosphatase [candidate division Zixibacteria bacterium]HOD65858.1 UDP-2,3-diacylglucosamine diphosphatase [candidate division Zixibacteria bacterium]HOZ07750.1 UDP-2,3-diacylglucosamine diphosphatase [candidate division Zixibacteria bacterium]
MALYVFSDAHLGSGAAEHENRKVAQIARLFELVRADGDRLVILGDLFDFWFEYRHAIPKDHHQVLFLLTDLVRRGIAVDYVSGNHDFWMDDFFATHIGVTVHRDHLDMAYGGRRLHLIHGDGLAPADRGYRLLKRILRHRFNIWLYRKLPPDWAIPLAKKVSGSSREYTSRRDHTFAKDYQAYAAQRIKAGFDVVVIGHLHIPVCTALGGGIYVNTGDFIHHFTYAKIADGAVTLERLA